MVLRIFLNLCTLVSVLWFPWWLTIGFLVLLLAAARAYEVLFWGFILDALYGAPVPTFFNLPLLFTAISGVLWYSMDDDDRW
jgi:hypothetical protein